MTRRSNGMIGEITLNFFGDAGFMRLGHARLKPRFCAGSWYLLNKFFLDQELVVGLRIQRLAILCA